MQTQLPLPWNTKKAKKVTIPSTAKAPDREKTPGFGLTLCNDYYEEIGKPALQSQFTDVWDRIAIGLVGEGSDCLGFDDELSRDHDWGPSFCMWLTNEDYATFGQALQKAYLALPHEFRGYQRQETQGGKGRVGVWRISDFYRHFIGLSRAPETLAEWIRIPESFLAKATNGHVFTDPLGKFSTIRQILLAFYPEDVRIKKIAYYACQMAQSGQYNYKRSLDRCNPATAACARYEFIKAAIAMVYLLNKKYMPFYKWAHHGLQYLPTLSDMYGKNYHPNNNDRHGNRNCAYRGDMRRYPERMAASRLSRWNRQLPSILYPQAHISYPERWTTPTTRLAIVLRRLPI